MILLLISQLIPQARSFQMNETDSLNLTSDWESSSFFLSPSSSVLAFPESQTSDQDSDTDAIAIRNDYASSSEPSLDRDSQDGSSEFCSEISASTCRSPLLSSSPSIELPHDGDEMFVNNVVYEQSTLGHSVSSVDAIQAPKAMSLPIPPPTLGTQILGMRKPSDRVDQVRIRCSLLTLWVLDNVHTTALGTLVQTYMSLYDHSGWS